MNGTIVVAAYRPRSGREAELDALVRAQVPRLRAVGLATEREAIAARTADGVVIEIFEWSSPDAVARAHEHPEVQQMWREFEACCWYETPSNVTDLQRMFVGLTPCSDAIACRRRSPGSF